ncbi:hypothetical protein EVAR_59159_1 [Eumeta japonica]|uniref:Uncharacterized protein n=1 Tax=Eumeta variegata TaxID=151549 RepID=A0A4C1YYR7_EUMVA|nr:hypothetical protein EVAR_59159_1 [Eumeta japonica]
MLNVPTVTSRPPAPPPSAERRSKKPQACRCFAPRPFLLLCRVPILRHCDAFVTNFTAVEFRALFCNSDALDQVERLLRHE